MSGFPFGFPITQGKLGALYNTTTHTHHYRQLGANPTNSDPPRCRRSVPSWLSPTPSHQTSIQIGVKLPMWALAMVCQMHMGGVGCCQIHEIICVPVVITVALHGTIHAHDVTVLTVMTSCLKPATPSSYMPNTFRPKHGPSTDRVYQTVKHTAASDYNNAFHDYSMAPAQQFARSASFNDSVLSQNARSNNLSRNKHRVGKVQSSN